MSSIGVSPVDQKKHASLTNGTGATTQAGAVIVIKADAAGNVFTTTSTNGDNKVFGVTTESIADLLSGRILTEGKTTALLVANGTSSIAIGDWLSTYSHAYYAKKAVAGDMAFALSLSTPTTGTAQVSALLVSPRLI